MSAICILLGSYVWLIALGIIPVDEDRIHAPAWVLLLCGGLFVIGGVALLAQSNELLVNILGNLMVVTFASISLWIALYGPAEQFSGGLPLVSHESNVKTARVMFGAGSLLCLLMLIPGIAHLMKLIRARDQADPG